MRTRSLRLAPLALAIPALAGALSVQAADQPQRLFLQQISPHSAIVKWRGGDASRVCYSTKLKDLSKPNWPRCVDGVEEANMPPGQNHKVARLTGLAPEQTYYYSLGSIASEDQQFRTPPNSNKPPKDGNTRLWLIGDSGTATESSYVGQAAAVAQGFRNYVAATGGEPADLLLPLGDNAYTAGTDGQWQTAFFDVYRDLLKSTSVAPTIGNHEMGTGRIDLCLFVPGLPCGIRFQNIDGTSSSADPASYSGDGNITPDGWGPPYLSIFSLPANGEAGGVPSGTEQYYSMDYGNVHVVSLDTQLTARDGAQRAGMREWLMADLGANTRDWTVVIFHHPPYTKGANHDSDDANPSTNVIDGPEWDVRNEFTPIFEAYGVDVVYSGHSHSYERSYYLRGHTGVSSTFDPAVHAELNAQGEPALGNGDEPYAQLSPTSGGVDDRVVYTVAGSSGKADSNSGVATVTTPAEWLRHPAHIVQPADTATPKRNGLAMLGSVVLDAGATSLTSRFIDVNGNVLDEFTIER